MYEKILSLSETQKKQLVNIVETYKQIHTDQVAQLAKTLLDAKRAIDESGIRIATRLVELAHQYRTAIQEGINNFDEPEEYDPTTVTIHEWTRGFVINMGIEMMDDLKTSYFNYLADRYENGLQAFLDKDWQKSIFTFLSCLDGILREFCEQHKATDCPFAKRFPFYQETFDHLMLHYRTPYFAGNQQFQDRLKAFFEHRHRIMHGDKYAFFDENIAIISLLFLGLVFYIVKDDI